jgi:hypothetical protein
MTRRFGSLTSGARASARRAAWAYLVQHLQSFAASGRSHDTEAGGFATDSCVENTVVAIMAEYVARQLHSTVTASKLGST